MLLRGSSFRRSGSPLEITESGARWLCLALFTAGVSCQPAVAPGAVEPAVPAPSAAEPSVEAEAQPGSTVRTGPWSGPDLCERLGFPRDAKLLILHTDDVGLSASTNRATFAALTAGPLSSGSVMVPAPGFAEVAAWVRGHPRADLGVHIDLTSEWDTWRWGPVVPAALVPALVQPDLTFFKTSAEAARAPLSEIEREVRAQIDGALGAGIDVTHLDAHMGSMYASSAVFDLLVELAGEYQLPFVLSGDWFEGDPGSYMGRTKRDFPEHVVMLETSVGADVHVSPEGWADYYESAIRSLKPGVSQIFIHVAFDDAETRAITAGHDGWNASWRQRDFDWVTSERLRGVLAETGTTVIGWRELRDAIRKPRSR